MTAHQPPYPPPSPGAAVESRHVVGAAFLQALQLVILRLFTIPYSIWYGAALRLSDVSMKQGSARGEERSEFPVFDWYRRAADGVIYLSWYLFAFLAIIALLGGFYDDGFVSGIGAMLGTLVGGYFFVIPMSLLKEGLIVIFSIAMNVERMAREGR